MIRTDGREGNLGVDGETSSLSPKPLAFIRLFSLAEKVGIRLARSSKILCVYMTSNSLVNRVVFEENLFGHLENAALLFVSVLHNWMSSEVMLSDKNDQENVEASDVVCLR